MIAKYNNHYFCIDESVNPVQIWAYVPVIGFQKKTTRRGTIYYEKFVDKTEIDEIFDVAFAVEWNGYWFGCDYLPTSQRVRLFSSSADIIEKFNMNEFERGAWDLYIDIHSCEKFKVTYEDYHTEKYTSHTVSMEDWIDLWNKLIVELIPQ